MLKLSKNHSIYEVWCEYTAESVFIDHKPTNEELEEIRTKNWPGTDQWGKVFVLSVFKLERFYTSTGDVKIVQDPKTLKCKIVTGNNKIIGAQG